MGPGTTIRAAAFAGLVACLVGWASAPGGAARAAELRAGEAATQPIMVAAGDYTSRFLPLGKGKSVVIDFPATSRTFSSPIRKSPTPSFALRAALISSPSSAGAPISSFSIPPARQMAGFDIAVTRDVSPIRAAIQQMIPDADIRVEGIGDAIILTGSVPTRPKRSRLVMWHHISSLPVKTVSAAPVVRAQAPVAAVAVVRRSSASAAQCRSNCQQLLRPDQQSRQLDHRPRPRSGHAQSDGRGNGPHRDQAVGR